MRECDCEEMSRPGCHHKWVANAEIVRGSRQVYVEHFGTSEDVRLYVNGNFDEEGATVYAEKIAEALNKVLIDG